MTPHRFDELLEAYGADFDRWPEHEREAGRMLATASPWAGAALDRARRLDAVLDAYPAPEPAFNLADRLADTVLAPAPAAPRRDRRVWRLPESWLQPLVGGLVAASLALALTWLEPLGMPVPALDPVLADSGADGMGEWR